MRAVDTATAQASAGSLERPLRVDGARGLPLRGSWPLRLLAAVASIWLLRTAQPVLAPLVIALVLAFVIAPMVRRLASRSVPPALAAGIVMALLLGSAVPVAAGLAGPVAQWWQRMPAAMTQLRVEFERLRSAVPGMAAPRSSADAPPTKVPMINAPPTNAPSSGSPGTRVLRVEHSPERLPTPSDPLADRLAGEGVALTGFLLGQGLSSAVSAAAALILLYFLLASEHWLLARSIAAIPGRRRRARVLSGLRAAQQEIGHYLVAMSALNVAAGVVTGLAVHALGLPDPTVWGVLVAVLCFVPYLGPLAIVGLLLMAGLVSFGDLPSMLAPAAAFVVIHAVETNLISPWVVGRRLSLSPISVLLAVLFWGWLWGISGALVAVPLLIALRGVCRRQPSLRLLAQLLDGDARDLPAWRTLLHATPPAAPIPAPAASTPAIVGDPASVAANPDTAHRATPPRLDDGSGEPGQVQSVQSVQPLQLVQPVQSVQPVQPVQPLQPVQSVHPVKLPRPRRP